MGLDKSNAVPAAAPPQHWWLPLSILGICFAIMLTGPAGQEWLRFDRVWLIHGESWRLVTGHLAHLGWSHFALNSAGLLLIWFLVGANMTARQWMIIIAATVCTIDIAFWVFNPELHWYVGLSGLLHGLLIAGILAKRPLLDTENMVLLVLLVAKLGWEQWQGAMPGSTAASGGPVIVDAHLYGALGGLLSALVLNHRVLRRPTI